MIRLYNTLTRKVEEFKPIQEGNVGIYACGPTVYWFAHVGNLRTYVFVDVLRRALSMAGLKTKLVMNVTDVGHLTDDADLGEDKMLLAMRREGKTAYDIARFYEAAFMKDLARLNVLPADAYPRATDNIPEQIDMIRRLEKNGYAYVTSDGVYFETSKLPDYGRLSGQKAEDKKAGARVDMGEKRNSTDFALWKFSPTDGKREMEWESPWGKGFPGWHIECSAMSKKFLGVPFDIHTGGIDHVPVHHENELAQTQGADGVLEANVWMHGEFLTVDGGKMSKSLGNLFTLEELVTRGFDPLAFRYFCLGAHYRTKLNFTWEALTAAQNALKRLRDTVRGWDEPGTVGCADHERAFWKAIEDDLNTPEALAALWNMVEDASLPSAAKAKSLAVFDSVFGLGLVDLVGKAIEVPDDVHMLVQAREAARKAKDWKESDRLRDEIAVRGFAVEDGANGPVIKTS
ncbi:cysteine--tRNA ligase [Patescibacteria group bacterium]|nr:MAG: cysteine--tRNA ligase [Patescibacteria group bacterium]